MGPSKRKLRLEAVRYIRSGSTQGKGQGQSFKKQVWFQKKGIPLVVCLDLEILACKTLCKRVSVVNVWYFVITALVV